MDFADLIFLRHFSSLFCFSTADAMAEIVNFSPTFSVSLIVTKNHESVFLSTRTRTNSAKQINNKKLSRC